MNWILYDLSSIQRTLVMIFFHCIICCNCVFTWPKCLLFMLLFISIDFLSAAFDRIAFVHFFIQTIFTWCFGSHFSNFILLLKYLFSDFSYVLLKKLFLNNLPNGLFSVVFKSKRCWKSSMYCDWSSMYPSHSSGTSLNVGGASNKNFVGRRIRSNLTRGNSPNNMSVSCVFFKSKEKISNMGISLSPRNWIPNKSFDLKLF